MLQLGHPAQPHYEPLESRPHSRFRRNIPVQRPKRAPRPQQKAASVDCFSEAVVDSQPAQREAAATWKEQVVRQRHKSSHANWETTGGDVIVDSYDTWGLGTSGANW